MWTRATRGRMAAIEKKTKRYPSDLTDEEWLAIEPVLPRPTKRGRKRTTDLREVVNAIRYIGIRGT
jgi:transposase